MERNILEDGATSMNAQLSKDRPTSQNIIQETLEEAILETHDEEVEEEVDEEVEAEVEAEAEESQEVIVEHSPHLLD